MSLICLDGIGTIGNIGDLTTPTSTQQYTLGRIVTFKDTDYTATKRFMYVKSHTTLTAYTPYVVNQSATAGAEVLTAAPATLADGIAQLVVPQVDFTSGYYGFVQIEGDGKVLMTSETYAVGDRLKMTNGTAYLSVDGTSASTTLAVTNCAICKEAGSTAVARKAYFFGRPATI